MAERFTIQRLGRRGEGLADTDAGLICIAGALPGEIVLAEGRERGLASLTAVETASPLRVPPICRHFGTCGGCAIQHAAPSLYADWKRGLVVDAMRRAGIAAEVLPLVDAQGTGRRRVTFHARRKDSGVQVGFARSGSHDIVAIEECPVMDRSLAGAIGAARAVAEILAGGGKPLDIHITATEGGLDIDVRGSGPLAPPVEARLVSLAARLGLARLTRHGNPVAMLQPPTVMIGPARVTLPAGSFLQATARGEEEIAARVMQMTEGRKTILDLFCGVGPFALRLARRANVTAVDSDAAAIAALDAAARNAGGLKVTARERDLFRNPVSARELAGADAVVLDPPRAGAEAQARQLAASKVPCIVSVSCDVATFARDAAVLMAGGYRLTEVTPIDQFRYSPHVEIVAQFLRP